ncbi:MAG: MMPL family transporter [Acidimicrobiales bacterium]
MFHLGRRCAAHPVRVLAAWLLVGAAVIGLRAAVGGDPTNDFRVPGVEAQRANDILSERFPSQAGWSGRIVFHVDDGRLDDPPARAAIERALDVARSGRGVVAVSDPFDLAHPSLSGDGRTAFANVNYASDAPDERYAADAEAAAALSRAAGVQTELSGEIVLARPVHGGEAPGLIAAIVVLLLAFGSVIATGIPIGTALVGLVIGLAGVGILAGTTDVSTSAPVLASMIGLGVGIDYALFVVTRHRQFLAEGYEPRDAAGRANATAGLSVLFAGCTVVIAICGLVLAGVPSIAMMGFAAAIVVLVSMLVAVTLLPALLGAAGRRIDRWSVHRHTRADRPAIDTLAGRWAHHVGRRPWRFAVLSLLLLVGLATPLVAMRVGFADDSNSPSSSTEYRAHQVLADAFGPGFNGPFVIVAELRRGDVAAVQVLTDALQMVPGVAAVQPAIVNDAGDTAVIVVQPTTGPQDAATAETLSRLREDVLPSVAARTGTSASVTGRTASFQDLSDRLTSRLPWFIAAVVGLSFVLLLVLFRSLLVPLKAAAMNLLSIGAAYGVVVAIFQWGWGRELFGVHATVPINPFVPMIMFAILFGLSMDYEVFLLSRVREEYERTGDSHRSVVDGLSATARVITSAALIMICVFLAFVAAPNVMIKMFGVGLATAVLIDATVVRMVLVPSTMALLGDRNWWLPRWLGRWLPSIDLEGSLPSLSGPTPVTAATEYEEFV